MRTDGGEKTGQEDVIGKRTISTNDILINQIVEVNIEDVYRAPTGNQEYQPHYLFHA
ncbi:MAG TPA: hypothetical protein VL087_07840 [Nitrospirota bacterium]|nr:hypothetical protein [Nitrospirota bacterium]